MNDILRGLFRDLVRRCQVLRLHLEHHTHHPDVQAYAAEILDFIAQIEDETAELMTNPILGTPRLQANYLRDFRLRAQLIRLLESFPVPAILTYGQSEHYFFTLITEIARQIQYPFSVPIVSSWSKDYYWAQPAFNLLGVPALEEHSLLGLPDLLHEKGHFILRQREKDLLERFRRQLKTHFARERRRARDIQKPPQYDLILDRIQKQWSDEWVVEFACDMIATYLVGPAYGWANLRLCSTMSNDIFRPGPDDAEAVHPADDARVWGIVKMLELLGLQIDACEIKRVWDDYAALAGHQPPPDYELCYPMSLLEKLAQSVIRGCATLQLKAYTEQVATVGEINIPILLNQAWKEFLEKPDIYPEWEEQALKKLRLALNL